MLAWMLLAMVPASALCIAALLAEQAARQRCAPSRWVWFAALAASLLLPVAGPLLLELAPVRLPLPPLPHGFTGRMNGAHGVAPLPTLDALARSVWLFLSVATLCAIAGGAWLLARRARGWSRTQVGATAVYVAPRSGPAVFGCWHPQIVLPAWLMTAPARQRDLALAHERSHLEARDPQLLAISLALVAVMPWNLPLWWQLHRLRCAIEVDCDQRVLSAGGDLVDYGETLIELSQHKYRHAGLMAAVPHSQSFLERRIRIMSTQPHRWSRAAATVLACLAFGVVALAAELTPPAVPMPPAPPRAAAPAVPAAPALPALAAMQSMPAAPALPALAALPPKPGVHATPATDSEETSESEDQEDSKMEAESAAEQAEAAKQEAEEAEAEAREAKHDAEEQMQEAAAAKHEAEEAEAAAHARKLEAEAAAQAARAQSRVTN